MKKVKPPLESPTPLAYPQPEDIVHFFEDCVVSCAEMALKKIKASVNKLNLNLTVVCFDSTYNIRLEEKRFC